MPGPASVSRRAASATRRSGLGNGGRARSARHRAGRQRDCSRDHRFHQSVGRPWIARALVETLVTCRTSASIQPMAVARTSSPHRELAPNLRGSVFTHPRGWRDCIARTSRARRA
jgi:hypothetical protein